MILKINKFGEFTNHNGLNHLDQIHNFFYVNNKNDPIRPNFVKLIVDLSFLIIFFNDMIFKIFGLNRMYIFIEELNLVKKISHGEFGIVYEGFYKKEIIACKVLKNADFSLFFNEIKIMKNLIHPNIPMYIGHCICNYKSYIIMERCYDLDLFEYINYFDLELINKKNISYQIIDTLDYIHSKKIIHRDLKLENIIINIKTLNIKIIDFGCAHYITEPIKGIVGTFQYMAPEILNNEFYSFPIDIYSYGMILYILWSNSINYSAFALFFHNIPRNYKNIIRQCLSINPNKRPSIQTIKNCIENK